MVTFEYKARDKSGKMVSGVSEAVAPEAVAANLRKLGYAVVAIKEKRASSLQKFSLFDIFTGVKTQDVTMFTRQLATLVETGIPLLSALESIKEQTTNAALTKAIIQMISDIRGGASLMEAMAKHPKCFNQTYIHMIAAAEASGKLQEALERLAIILDYEEATKNKIKAATRYPLTVTSALVIAFVVLTMFVLPRYANIYARFNAQLPLPTRILLGINFIFTHYWYIVIILVIGAIVGFRYYISTVKGRFLWDTFKIKVPIFGQLMLKISISRFMRIAGLMLKSGVPILKVLDHVANVTGNVVISKSILRVKENVNVGKGIAASMKQEKIYPPVVVQMISLGEETGKLDELFVKVSNFFDAQIDMMILNMTSLLEPLLISVLGLGVLTMALSVFLPMWNLMSVFKK